MSQLDQATQRLLKALDSLERAAARVEARKQDVGDLNSELAALKKENATLRSLGGDMAGRLDSAIDRLKTALEA